MMLTRVPWPGGNGGGGGGGSVRESSFAVVSGGLAWIGCGGGATGGALMLEMLIEEKSFPGSCMMSVRGGRQTSDESVAAIRPNFGQSHATVIRARVRSLKG